MEEKEKEKKPLTPEEYTRIDFAMVRKILNEYFYLKGVADKNERKKLFAPLYRLYLKATGQFKTKET